MMVRDALRPFENHLRKAIRGKQVVIKPNFVWTGKPLCATHPDAVRAVLDVLAPMYDRQIIIGEAAIAPVGTTPIFEEYGYTKLKRDYNVELVDFNSRPTTTRWVLTDNIRPTNVEVIDDYFAEDHYIISVTRLKTHDTVVATLGLKNIVMGSLLTTKEKNFKRTMHGPAPWWLNYNMFLLARDVRPDFTVLDGLEGMQGNGPVGGEPMEHGVALAGPDVLAVDRTACDLMGIDVADVGYLNYCADAGMGNIARDRIKILGGLDIDDYAKTYKLHKNIDWQLTWKNDLPLPPMDAR
jgi:uncharacterized protein (DUF362 family)